MTPYQFDRADCEKAWRRIGVSADGRLARVLLESLLLNGIAPRQSDGAVREEVGRLNLARDLLNLFDNASADAQPELSPGSDFQPDYRPGHLAGPGKLAAPGAGRPGGRGAGRRGQPV